METKNKVEHKKGNISSERQSTSVFLRKTEERRERHTSAKEAES